MVMRFYNLSKPTQQNDYLVGKMKKPELGVDVTVRRSENKD